LESGERLRRIPEDKPVIHQSGYREDAENLVRRGADYKPLTSFRPPPVGAQDQGDSGRVDELARLQVDQDHGVLGVDAVNALLELIGHRQIELAFDFDLATPRVSIDLSELEVPHLVLSKSKEAKSEARS
jgi:hypothetical protein